MSAAAELQAMREWQDAYLRTDLVARMGFAALADYRHNGVDLDLPQTIVNQLDRFEQARELEEEAHHHLEQIRGAA